MVARGITKPQRKCFRFESHWLLFFILFFNFYFRGWGSEFIILAMSYSSEFTVVCVVTDELYMCLIHVVQGTQWLSGRVLDRDRSAAGSSLDRLTALWSLSKAHLS